VSCSTSHASWLGGAGGVLVGEEKIVDDQQPGVRHGGQRHAVVSSAGEVALDDGAGCGREIGGFGDGLRDSGEEGVVRGVERVVGAAGVVVAHADIERHSWKGRAQCADDGADRLLGEGDVVGGGGCG
jgi:hypothetical protein